LIRRYPGTSQAPFVWVFGRKDSTVSVMGANVYPEDIEQSLYAIPALASVTRSYCLGVVDLPDGLRRAVASFEVTAEITDELAARFDEAVFEGIHRRSPDFREAYKNRPDLVRPLIQLHGPGDGPFADGDWRIKQRRLLSQQSHA
jgi:phenylacetate-CoA ligase